MTQVIASPSSAPYFAAMLAMILRLLTVIALALMPLGMQGASAKAHHAPAEAAAAHCDEQGGQPAHESSDQAIDCAMVCSMLVTLAARTDEPAPSLGLPVPPTLAEHGRGIHPDTATPPPKLS